VPACIQQATPKRWVASANLSLPLLPEAGCVKRMFLCGLQRVGARPYILPVAAGQKQPAFKLSRIRKDQKYTTENIHCDFVISPPSTSDFVNSGIPYAAELKVISYSNSNRQKR